jgi:hypothetical protein
MSSSRSRIGLFGVVVICTGVVAAVLIARPNTRHVAVRASKAKSAQSDVESPSAAATNDGAWHVVQDFGAIVDGQFGWAATESSLLLTRDSGNTWSDTELPTTHPLFALQFDTPQHALAIAQTSDPQTLEVFATTDGAASWTSLGTTHVRGVVGIAGASLAHAGQTWWLLATEATGTGVSFGTSLRSTDGGGSWTAADGVTPGGGIVALGSTAAVLVGGPGSQNIYETTDGGSTWPALDVGGALGPTPESEPSATSFGRPLLDGDHVLVPGVRSIGSDERSVVLDIQNGEVRVALSEDNSTSVPVPINANSALINDTLVHTDGTVEPATGSLPSVVASLGPKDAFGIRTEDQCAEKANCSEISSIVVSHDLRTWETISTGANALPPEPVTTTTSASANEPTGPEQTLTSGEYLGSSWRLVAAPTASGFCYGIGYGSPSAKTCLVLPTPAPAILAIVNHDPPIALGVVRSDVSSVEIRFVSGKPLQAELHPSPEGFAQGQWYAMPVPAGEIVIAQVPLDANGSRLK